MYISLIGSGNVATRLAYRFVAQGHLLCEVSSRNSAHAQALVQAVGQGQAQTHLDFGHSHAQLFIIATHDAAIAEVAAQIRLPAHAILVHTSGSVPMTALSTASVQNVEPHLGVFYPLQTLSAVHEIDFARVPLLLEATDAAALGQLEQLAQSLGSPAYHIRSQERTHLHLAAVLACNFANHLWALADDYLQQQGIDFEILHPLISETLRKALATGAKNAQTGPARRGDVPTIATHHGMLATQPLAQQIYALMSESILHYYTPIDVQDCTKS